MTEKLRNIIIRYVPESIHRGLKSRAALEGKTLQGLILEVLKQYLERREGDAYSNHN